MFLNDETPISRGGLTAKKATIGYCFVLFFFPWTEVCWCCFSVVDKIVYLQGSCSLQGSLTVKGYFPLSSYIILNALIESIQSLYVCVVSGSSSDTSNS